MPRSRYPTTQVFSEQFVTCSGTVLFGPHIHSNSLTVCILHHLTKNEWLLPKGHKDRDESIEAAAIRETYEETGFPCILLPIDLLTRATIPGADLKEDVRLHQQSTEPFALSIRHVSETNMKMIWWFIAQVKEGAVQIQGTQMQNENFEARFMDAEEAISKLTFDVDKDVVRKAVKLVKETYGRTEGVN